MTASPVRMRWRPSSMGRISLRASGRCCSLELSRRLSRSSFGDGTLSIIWLLEDISIHGRMQLKASREPLDEVLQVRQFSHLPRGQYPLAVDNLKRDFDALVSRTSHMSSRNWGDPTFLQQLDVVRRPF